MGGRVCALLLDNICYVLQNVRGLRLNPALLLLPLLIALLVILRLPILLHSYSGRRHLLVQIACVRLEDVIFLGRPGVFVLMRPITPG